MRSIAVSAIVALCFVVAGCGKSDKESAAKEGQGAAPASKPAEQAAAPAQQPAGPTAIEKLGLEADLPAGAKIGDGVVGEGVLIQAPDLVVSIEEASDMTPETLDAAKENADMYTPKNMKEEALADGYALTYENEGGLGTNYFVNVRREIGGKAYWCTTTASNPKQSVNALAVCKSLQQ